MPGEGASRIFLLNFFTTCKKWHAKFNVYRYSVDSTLGEVCRLAMESEDVNRR